MKILGGELKGRRFYMPHGIRPTQDIVRKAVFDILGQDISGMDFLDLFSGSGAMVLEAVSRQAHRAVGVEINHHNVQVIQENLELLEISSQKTRDPAAFVIYGDVFDVVKHFHAQSKTFDVVFLDPPFEQDLAKKTLNALEAHDILRPTCSIIVQHSKREILPESFGRFFVSRQKRYGGAVLSIYSPGTAGEKV